MHQMQFFTLSKRAAAEPPTIKPWRSAASESVSQKYDCVLKALADILSSDERFAMIHDRTHDEYQVFSAASVRKWSKFGLERILLEPPWVLRGAQVLPRHSSVVNGIIAYSSRR
jgi:hypothetical protein